MLAASATLAKDTQLGKYVILRELGRGGMGEVYLAKDTHLGREVALKRLLPIFAEDEDFLSRFKREAQAISRISHPGVVSIHSLDWIDGLLLIDMEFVGGPSLSKVLNSSTVTPLFTARTGRSLLHALRECHDQGIVHRDIKPSNVLFTNLFNAKLVDFGIATALADSAAAHLKEGRSTTVVMGTPRFMPPEAWDGGEVSPQWDIFSLGVLLYECVTGERAYAATSTSALAKQITNQPLLSLEQLVPKVSRQLARAVDSMVCIDPAKRCASAVDALALLNEAPELRELPESTTQPARTGVRKRWISQPGKFGSTKRRPRSISRRGATMLMVAPIVLVLAAYWPVSWYFRDAFTGDSLGGSSTNLSNLTATLANAHFFTASPVGTGSEETWHWWLLPRELAPSPTYVGYSELALMHVTMSEDSSGQVRYEGQWAGYGSRLGRPFNSGAVRGAGRRQRGGSVTATLTFANESDHSERTSTFAIEAQPDAMTREAYVASIERSEMLPALLFNEMMPRNLELAHRVGPMLPSARGQRSSVPLISTEERPAIDGVLDDAVWQRVFLRGGARVGEIPAVNGSGSTVLVRYDSSGLYLAARARGNKLSGVKLTLALLMGVARPPQDAPIAMLSFVDAELTDRSFFEGGRELPFPEGWIFAVLAGESAVTLELFVPRLETGDSALDSPAPHGPWRVNLSVAADSSGGNEVPVAHWGTPRGGDVIHGALLDFIPGP